MVTPYRVPVLEHFAWQPPVLKIETTQPLVALKGDRYIVGVGATGASWTGQDNKIAYCSNATGPVWSFDTPVAGWTAYITDIGKFYYFTGLIWTDEASTGASGYSGYSGPGFIWKGPWASAQSYYSNDIVSHNGSTYVCILTHVSGVDSTWSDEPGVGANWTTYWALFASGTSGYSGQSGYSGYSGQSGYSGYSGQSGYSGYSGESGYSGYSGISGYSGYSGESGYSGYSGESGYSGYSGSGVSGYSGYSGESGYSGYSGESGYSGYSGLSGYSGYSGPSGYSGYSGFSGSPGTLVGITYYTDDQNSDVGTDKRMLRSPDADPEVQYSAVGSGGGTVIKEFCTILGDPGQNLITNGTWQSNLWAYLDSAGGNNTVVVNVYKVDPTGPTYTLLFSFDPVTVTDVSTPTSFLPAIAVQGDIALASTDRLAFEYVAYSDSGKTISLCVGGAAHFSHVHTPLITQGYSGISGYSGATVSGYSGYSGESTSGYSGYSGPSGYSGYSGESGYSGYSGVSGYSGYSGESGYSGYSGPSGYSGYSGESGYSGYSGLSGYSGYSGESGYSGYSGESGYSGYSGISGYSGYSGTSGYSGYSGFSGYSGYSGPGADYDGDYECLIISA